MTRFIPYPTLGLFLFALWMGLGGSFSPGWTLLGVGVAIAGTWVMAALRLDEPTMRNARAAIRLAAVVSVDIIRSNIAVARIIGNPGRELTSGFLVIPLDLEHPTALAILGMIVTSTPGTVWVDLAVDGTHVTLHVLDLRNEEEWIRWIKDRYEQVLMRIFE